MTERVLNQKELAAFVGVSRMTLHRWELGGHLPTPVFMHGKNRFWTEQQAEQLKQMVFNKSSVLRRVTKS